MIRFKLTAILLILLFVFGCSHSLQPLSSRNSSSPENQCRQTPDRNTAGSGTVVNQQDNMVFGNYMASSQDKADPGTAAAEPSPEQNIQAMFDDALEYCQTSREYWQKGEFENALESLDQAYELIIRANTDDVSGYLQQKEDLRFMISKRILEIYASRNTIANGKFNAIPIVLNKYTKNELHLFTKGAERRFFIESFKRSGRYRPKIVAELKAAGLPEELSWLPLIESGYKVRALSKARALGLWQFIPSTGYKFGLKRDQFVDERLDPDKATKAAIAYLKELHNIFGDWATVLAAYNCGEGRVLRVIRSQNVNYLDNFWDLYERLPRETARYVPRFLATLHIVKNPEKYGLDKIQVDAPVAYETVSVKKQFLLKDAAISMGLHEKMLDQLNPELRHKVIPAGSYALKVPAGQSNVLLSKIDKIPETHIVRINYIRHRVRNGETLSTIARRYKTSVRSIARANNIRRYSYIVAGKVLKIPQKGSMQVYKSTNRGDLTIHIAKPGDSLWNIARSYGTTVNKIKAINNLSSNYLRVGQALKIPS